MGVLNVQSSMCIWYYKNPCNPYNSDFELDSVNSPVS